MQRFTTMIVVPITLMSLLGSSWALPHTTRSKGSTLQLDDTFFLNKGTPLRSKNSTLQMNVTAQEGGWYTSAARQALEPNASVCNDVAILDAPDFWSQSNASAADSEAWTIFLNNGVLCDECLGTPKEQLDQWCPKYKDSCIKTAIQDLSGQRFDGAMSRLANWTGQVDLECDIGDSSNCESAPDCPTLRSPGMWAIVKSLTVLHNSVSMIHSAIDQASDSDGSAGTMETFASVFAPVPVTSDAASEILEAILGAVFGFAGALLAGPEAEAVNIVATVTQFGEAVSDATQSDDADTQTDPAQWLSTLANAIKTPIEDISASLFKTGLYSNANQSITINITDMFSNGAYMETDPTANQDALTTLYEQLLFQQLAVFTWNNLQKDNHKHFPFIAFDNEPCESISSGSSKFGAFNLNSHVTYQGACYYLLDAVLETVQGFVNPVGGISQSTFKCTADNALPGGTTDSLGTAKQNGTNTAALSGLTIESFIVPSVEGWTQNNKQNGGPAATFQTGKIPKTLLDAGVVRIPVCDYGTGQTAGTGCPDFSAPVTQPGNGCPVTT